MPSFQPKLFFYAQSSSCHVRCIVSCVACPESRHLCVGSQLNVVAMQHILHFTEDQKRALLSHRRTYIAHMTQLSKLRKQLLQQLHSETALEISNGELEARQTCEDQTLRQLENCTVEANRRYFDYVGAVGHDVSLLPACGTSLPFQPSQHPSPCPLPFKAIPPPPGPQHALLCLPPLHARANQRWNHDEYKCHHVCIYLALATLLVPACVLNDDHQS